MRRASPTGCTTAKAAAIRTANYYDGDYAVTQSGSYSSSQNYLTDAGAYGTDSHNYYGINDMAGNVWEWNDLDAESGSSRGLRGGSFNNNENNLRSSNENNNVGFRVARPLRASTSLPNGQIMTVEVPPPSCRVQGPAGCRERRIVKDPAVE